MLTQLYIKNFTLIDTLTISLNPGFSVITGETGAGKSIVLGAIGLLLGQRADAKTVKQGTDKCIIEGHFSLGRYHLQQFFEAGDIEYDPDDTIIRRELTSAGKSRAFVNDTPVPLSTLKELGQQLIDIHSQHQNLLLQKHDFQLSVVDTISANTALQQDYAEAYALYRAAQHRLTTLSHEIEQNRQRTDFLKFQYSELSDARLKGDEQQELEQKSAAMTHAEEIKTALYQAGDALSGDTGGVLIQLRRATTALGGIARVYPIAGELAERMESSYIELKDIAQEVESRTSDVDFDPAELEAVNSRLDRLYDLQQKYHAESVDRLIELQQELERQLSAIENSDEALSEAQVAVERSEAECRRLADLLTAARTKAAQTIEADMSRRLVPLGMPHVRFAVHMTITDELTPTGQDHVEFLFTANTSTPQQPIVQVASGGEIARVMLSLKAMISGAVKLPTIIFDEIDTGVSGKIAEQMARMMQQMGQGGRQVISITHLPQIAALGANHYKVEKAETAAGTTSTMRQLTDEERVTEIAQMLSGTDVTEAAVANARQLLGS